MKCSTRLASLQPGCPRKSRKLQITKIRNERENITTNLTNSPEILHFSKGEYERIGGKLFDDFQKWLSRKKCANFTIASCERKGNPLIKYSLRTG